MVPVRLRNKTVCIMGLGYVGLPLAEAFAMHLKVIGFDIDPDKIGSLNKRVHEDNLELTLDAARIREADFIMICVPTPITRYKEPDLRPIISAAEMIGKNLKPGAFVIVESTVYPGVTEDIVAPILERESKMVCGRDFKVGYSPERINPGDNEHTIEKIIKIVAGMDEASTKTLAELYGLITTVYPVNGIKTAEAAKVIENIQRDLNIALINELTIIFHKIGLDTYAVLEAAGTKWNFHKYSPGLVGGHCIPVDPYYLVHKARALGYHPQVILAGRAINDYMPKYVAEMAIRGLNESGRAIKGSKALIMGLTYKANVADTRESPASEIVKYLKDYGVDLYGYDPLLNQADIKKFGIKPLDRLDTKMDCVIFTVDHAKFKQMRLEDIKKFLNKKAVIIDIRRILEGKEAEDTEIYRRSL